MQISSTVPQVTEYVSNPDNYKRCMRKKYYAYVGLVPQGTVAYDFTYNRYLRAAYQRNILFSGVLGEQRFISPARLDMCFRFVGAPDARPTAILQRIVTQMLPTDFSVFYRVEALSAQEVDERQWAVMIPDGAMLKYQTRVANIPGVNHGNGDFIVCGDLNGKPNLGTGKLVNGMVFGSTYNVHGWEKECACLEYSPLKPILPKGIIKADGSMYSPRVKSSIDAKAVATSGARVTAKHGLYAHVFS